MPNHRKTRYFFLVILFIVFLPSCNTSTQTDVTNNKPLSESILGKWERTHVSNQKYRIENIEFIDKGRLSYDVISEDSYPETATYHFISDNVIQLQGRRDATILRWQITRADEQLEICFKENSCETFRRKGIEWFWVIFGLITVTGIVIFRLKNRKPPNT